MDLSVNKKPILHHLSSLNSNMRLIILNVRLDTIKPKSGCAYSTVLAFFFLTQCGVAPLILKSGQISALSG